MTTAHTHGPNFGRREPGCPRCSELEAGAEPVRRRSQPHSGYPSDQEIRQHNCRRAGCGQCAPSATGDGLTAA